MSSYLAEQFGVIPIAIRVLLLVLVVKIPLKKKKKINKMLSRIFEFKVFI